MQPAAWTIPISRLGQGGDRCEGRVSLHGATRRASGRAAHINFLILYSGLMRQLQTTLFFEAERDPVLAAVERRVGTSWSRSAWARRAIASTSDCAAATTPFFDD